MQVAGYNTPASMTAGTVPAVKAPGWNLMNVQNCPNEYDTLGIAKWYPDITVNQIKGYHNAYKYNRCLQAESVPNAWTTGLSGSEAGTVTGLRAGICNTKCGLQSFCWNSDGTLTLNNGGTRAAGTLMCVVANNFVTPAASTA